MSVERKRLIPNSPPDPIRLHVSQEPEDVFAGISNGLYYESLLSASSYGATPREVSGYYPWEMFGRRSAGLFERGMKRVKRWSGSLSPADGFVDDNLTHTIRMLTLAHDTVARLPEGVVYPHSLRMMITAHDAGEIIVGDLPTSPFDANVHRDHKSREVAAVLKLVPHIPSTQLQEIVVELFRVYINRSRFPLEPNPAVTTAHLTKLIDLLDARRVLIEHGARDTATGQIITNPRGELGRKLSSQSLDGHLQHVLDCTEDRMRPAVQDVLEDLIQM